MHNGALKKWALALAFWAGLHTALLRAQTFTAPLQASTTGTNPVDFEFRADGTLVAKGNLGVGSLLSTDQGAGTRMLWFPDLGAFRAGGATGTEWNVANIGQYSAAWGYGTTASGAYSAAFGGGTTASGKYAAAFGLSTASQAMLSFTIGQYNVGGGTGTSWVATDPIFEIGNGTESAPSDALVVYKNGNITINGIDNEMPNQTLVNANSILTEGLGDSRYASASAFSAGSDGSGGTTALSLNGGTASGYRSFAEGSAWGSPSIASGYHSVAFNGGTASSNYSVAMGPWSTASGWYAVAMGYGSNASGGYSTAMGQATAGGRTSTAMGRATASGTYSTAMGLATASGYSSTAMGFYSIASGTYSTAMGAATASGTGSTAMGDYSTASGNYSTAMGSSRASGIYSFASGESSTASGNYSTAMGSSRASGIYSFASGESSTASGNYSTAMSSGQASGNYSISMGNGASASGARSIAMSNAQAIGDNSTAIGTFTTAGTDYSMAMGFNSWAWGNGATAIGNGTSASGSYSMALGHQTSASAYGEVTLGQYNVEYGLVSANGATTWVATDPLLELGNGTSYGSRSDALVVYKNGNATFQGAVSAAPGGDIPMYTGE